MFHMNRIAFILLSALSIGIESVSAREVPAAKGDLQLSPELNRNSHVRLERCSRYQRTDKSELHS
jgi:hypothetical protein